MKSIGDLLGDFSQQKKLKKPILEARVVSLWKPLMGELIHKYTEKVFVKNRVLFVKVQQGALKNELMYLQEQIIEKINKEVGEDAIVKLVIL
ncbi:MAG: putative nucleic acid-binding Zn ribbon protein [Chitinophagales bacterium]|jgi:predicted nucleic acid-binding Zn ribbon protein